MATFSEEVFDLLHTIASSNKVDDKSIRQLMFTIVEPAAKICLETKVQKAFEIGKMYFEERKADYDQLQKARNMVYDVSLSDQYLVNSIAALAVCDALNDNPRSTLVMAARRAIEALTIDASSKSNEKDVLLAYIIEKENALLKLKDIVEKWVEGSTKA